MRFRAAYTMAVALIAAVDGAYLGGVAALITAIGGIVLGVLAYRRGQGSVTTDSMAAGWKVAEKLASELAEERRLRREAEAEVRRLERRRAT